MASKQELFLDETLGQLLRPGETVLAAGVAEDPLRWVVAKLTLGILGFRRRFYYVVLTDQRLLWLVAPKKRFFAFAPWPRLCLSAGLNVGQPSEVSYDQVVGIVSPSQSPVHLLLGWRSARFMFKDGTNLPLFVRRGNPLLPARQKDLYNGFIGQVAGRSGVKPKRK